MQLDAASRINSMRRLSVTDRPAHQDSPEESHRPTMGSTFVKSFLPEPSEPLHATAHEKAPLPGLASD